MSHARRLAGPWYQTPQAHLLPPCSGGPAEPPPAFLMGSQLQGALSEGALGYHRQGKGQPLGSGGVMGPGREGTHQPGLQGVWR